MQTRTPVAERDVQRGGGGAARAVEAARDGVGRPGRDVAQPHVRSVLARAPAPAAHGQQAVQRLLEHAVAAHLGRQGRTTAVTQGPLCIAALLGVQGGQARQDCHSDCQVSGRI